MIRVTDICEQVYLRKALSSQVSILARKVTFAKVSLSVKPFAMMTLLYAGIRPQVLCNLIGPVRGAVTARVLRTDPAIPSPKPCPCVVHY